MLHQNIYRDISEKAASYQIIPGDIGKIFTNRGASGSITLTLPPVADLSTGWWCRFSVVVDQTVVIASSGSADNINAFNDIAADSIAFQTSGEKVGGGGELVWDGTKWLVFLNLAAETQTPTVA